VREGIEDLPGEGGDYDGDWCVGVSAVQSEP